MIVAPRNCQVATPPNTSRELGPTLRLHPKGLNRQRFGISRSRCSGRVRTMAVSAAPQAAIDAKRVTFDSPNRDSIVGMHTLLGSRHAVLLQHGYGSNKDGFHLRRIAQTLAGGGVGSLRFDFSGNGESSGSFRFANYAAEVDEMKAAADYLSDTGSNLIGILGHSKAGTEVIQYGARFDSRDLSIVNVCGRFNLSEGIKERFSEDDLATLRRTGRMQVPHPRTGKPFTVTQQELDERLQTDMGEVASSVRLSHVLTIHGTADETIPVSDAAEFDERIRLHKLEMVEGADHGFTSEQHASQVCDLVTRFFIAASARQVMRGR